MKITKSCKPKDKTWEKESSKKTHFCPLTTTLHVVLTFQKCLQRLFLFPSLSKVEISCILVHTLPFVLCLTIYFFLLQVKSGTIFDNVLVTDSVEYAENFAKETFEKTKEGEKKMKDEQDEKERKEREEEEKKAKEEEDKKKAEEEDEEEEEGEEEESKEGEEKTEEEGTEEAKEETTKESEESATEEEEEDKTEETTPKDEL